MVIFSDLHLREQSEATAFAILQEIGTRAAADDGHIVCCGDFWHLRYQINVRLLNRVCAVLKAWQDAEIFFDLVPGNHDQVDTSGRNALEVFEGFANVRVWTEPGVDEHSQFGYVPYRKDPQQQQWELEAVSADVSPDGIIFGHFGVHGAIMNNGRKNDSDGLALAEAPRGQYLVLGHYHRRQFGKGYEYVGSPYQTGFGEAGNDKLGCLRLTEGKITFEPLDVGAPKHYIVKWDPATEEQPPEWPGLPHDRVRLDIAATQEMITSGKFKGVLRQHGLDEAQVNIIPTPVERDHRFTVQQGEDLVDAAERFATERLDPKVGQPATDAIEAKRSDQLMVPHNPDLAEVMEALRRWA